jgi:hypothetical protein
MAEEESRDQDFLIACRSQHPFTNAVLFQGGVLLFTQVSLNGTHDELKRFRIFTKCVVEIHSSYFVIHSFGLSKIRLGQLTK